MNCERAGELLFARIDGRLTEDDARQLGLHLSTCEACRTEADGLGQL